MRGAEPLVGHAVGAVASTMNAPARSAYYEEATVHRRARGYLRSCRCDTAARNSARAAAIENNVARTKGKNSRTFAHRICTRPPPSYLISKNSLSNPSCTRPAVTSITAIPLTSQKTNQSQMQSSAALCRCLGLRCSIVVSATMSYGESRAAGRAIMRDEHVVGSNPRLATTDTDIRFKSRFDQNNLRAFTASRTQRIFSKLLILKALR